MPVDLNALTPNPSNWAFNLWEFNRHIRGPAIDINNDLQVPDFLFN